MGPNVYRLAEARRNSDDCNTRENFSPFFWFWDRLRATRSPHSSSLQVEGYHSKGKVCSTDLTTVSFLALTVLRAFTLRSSSAACSSVNAWSPDPSTTSKCTHSSHGEHSNIPGTVFHE